MNDETEFENAAEISIEKIKYICNAAENGDKIAMLVCMVMHHFSAKSFIDLVELNKPTIHQNDLLNLMINAIEDTGNSLRQMNINNCH